MKFYKMHGIGNDFIVIDCIKQSFTDEELSKIMETEFEEPLFGNNQDISLE